MFRRKLILATVIVLLSGSWMLGSLALAQVNSNDNNIAMMDNCDPSDPGWAPTGGCALRRGTVSVSEFFNFLFSPVLVGTAPVGHPSWRNEPSYISTAAGRPVRVTNWGGRAHTFTEVANYGGGFVPILNGSLTPAPECNPATNVIVEPGQTTVITGLAPGSHKFMCCIHPWMRAAIEVK
jgi:plastocyanin